MYRVNPRRERISSQCRDCLYLLELLQPVLGLVGVSALLAHSVLQLELLYQCCMVYAIHKGGRGGSYFAQQSCDSIAMVWALQVGG